MLSADYSRGGRTADGPRPGNPRRFNRRVLRFLSSVALVTPVFATAIVGASSSGTASPAQVGLASTRVSSQQFETDISGNGNTTVQGEPEIAVNPTNPNNLLIDWTIFTYNPIYTPLNPDSAGAMVSDNGGLTWRPVDLGINHLTPFGCGDAVAAAGPDGTLYAGGGCSTFVGFGGPVGGVFTIHGKDVVTRSTDGGNTWSPAVETVGSDGARIVSGSPDDPFDRPWLAVDQSTNAVYAAGANIVNHERFVTASTDEAQTFGPVYAVDSPNYPEVGGATIAAANGALAVAYEASAAPGATCPCVIFETSTDSGATFSRHVVPLLGASNSPSPIVAADPAGNGQYAVTVFDSTGTQLQVYVTDDSGQTWRGPTSVGEAPADQRFKPMMSYSPSGELALMWRTLYSDNSYDIWAATGRQEGNNGVVFTSPLRVSGAAAPYPAHCSLGGFFGPTTCFGDDFSWITIDHQYVHVAWGDSRNGAVQTWYGRIPLAAFKAEQG
jgi:hypothetical protein